MVGRPLPISRPFFKTVFFSPGQLRNKNHQKSPKNTEGRSKGSEGFSNGSEGCTEGSEGLSKGSEGLSKGSEGLSKGSEGFTKGSEGLSKGSRRVPVFGVFGFVERPSFYRGARHGDALRGQLSSLG